MHVADVAAANVAAAEHADVAGVFNLGSATRVTVNWLADRVIELAGTAVGIAYGPERPGDVRDSLAAIERRPPPLATRRQSICSTPGRVPGWLRHDPVSAQARRRA